MKSNFRLAAWVSGIVVASATECFGLNFAWRNTTGGWYGDVANWCEYAGNSDYSTDVDRVPGSMPECWTNCIGGTAESPLAYTVNFDSDVTLHSAYFATGNARVADVTLDLNGHVFSITNQFFIDGWSVSGTQSPSMSLTVSNGTFNVSSSTAYNTRMNRWSVAGYYANLTFGAGLDAKFKDIFKIDCRSPRKSNVTIKDGARVVFGTCPAMDSASNVILRITGEGTSVTNLSNGEWYINDGCEVLVEDRATYEFGYFRVWGNNGRFTFDNVVCTNRSAAGTISVIGYTQYGKPATNCVVECRNGAKVGLMKGLKLEGPDGAVLVRGGSDLYCASGLYLSSRDGRVEVDDSNLSTGSGNAITLGGNGTYVWGKSEASSNCLMRISGRNGHVSTGRLTMYSKSTLEFDIPKDGYARMPLEVTTETGFVTNTDCHVVINADKFLRAHPGETITLATFKTPRDTTYQTYPFNTIYAITNNTRFVRHGREYRINENPALTGTISYSVASSTGTLTYTAPVSAGLVIQVD